MYAGEGWGELYDTRNDPLHLRNLWGDPKSVEIKAALLARLSEEMAFAMDESPRALKNIQFCLTLRLGKRGRFSKVSARW